MTLPAASTTTAPSTMTRAMADLIGRCMNRMEDHPDKRFERQRQAAAASLSAKRPAPAAPIIPAFGAWHLADLQPAQCRFACTPDNARPEDHRFCGRPTRVSKGNLHGSWCDHHLSLVWGQGTKGERMATERPRGE